MNFKRITVIMISLAVTALMFTACGKEETGDILIGVAGAHSGDLASYGLPTVKAAELVVDKVNAAGGINGRKVRLVVEDDACKPEQATNAATKLIGEGVVAVIGHICSGATESAVNIYKQSDIICMSPSATKPSLTENENFFRTIAPDNAQAELDVDFVLNTLKLKKIAILHDKGDYGKGFAEFCKTYLEKDGTAEIVMFDGITPGAVDYSAVINKLKATGADGVIYGGYHPEASKLITQMKKKNINIPFISDDGVKDDTFIKVAGKYSECVYASGPQDTSNNPIAKEAKKAHIDKYGEEPGAFFLNAYAAALAITNAIEKAGSTDYDDLKKALRNEYVETSLGKIKFDNRGDAIGVGFAMYVVKNGKYVEVK